MALQDVDDNDSDSEREVLWVKDNSEQESADKETQPWFLLPCSVTVASLGGILFGYDIGIISGAILILREEFNLNCFQQELVVTFLIVGGLVSSLTGGFLLDHFGRKVTIILNAFLFLIGALILSFANSFPIFLFGRLVLGYAVALSAVGDCVYISEIAPPRKRGLLVSLNELGITLGILLAYLVNYLLIDYKAGWRYMFGLSAIPAFFQALGMLFLPYSPRWLVIKGKDEKAEQVISLLWPHLNARLELSRLKSSLSREQNYRFLDLFSKKDNMRMRMLIGCGIIFFQQLTGQPTVLYYAPVLFKTLGFDMNTSATLATIGLGVVKVVFTLGTLLVVDKLGRRTFLLLGAMIMTISLIILSAVTEPFHNFNRTPACHDVVGGHTLPVHLVYNKMKNCTTSNSTFATSRPQNVSSILEKVENAAVTYHKNYINNNNRDDNYKNLNTTRCHDSNIDRRGKDEKEIEEKSKRIPQAVKYTCLLALMLFVIGYAVGYGPMSWLLLTEIFPTAIKGRAASVATSVNWGTNIIISMTFLDVIGSIGPFFTFLIYSIIGAVSIIFLYHFVPETKGKSLEDISDQLNNKSLRCTTVHCCGRGQMVYVEKDENDILLTDDRNSINNDDEAEHVM